MAKTTADASVMLDNAMGLSYARANIEKFNKLPYNIKWRYAIVRAPWFVPNAALRVTSPDGPLPKITYLPSRHKDVFIPVHVFLPKPNPDMKSEDVETLPVNIDFHGGSFIMGSCLEQAPFCSMLARERNCVVLSVDYRKGPFDQFPAANEDAEDVLAAVLDAQEHSMAGRTLRFDINGRGVAKRTRPIIKLDANRVSLSGFSSGGNLALNLALSVNLPDKHWPSLLPEQGNEVPLLLFYPSLDARQLPNERPLPPSMPVKKPGWMPDLKLEETLMPTYLPPDQRTHPRASPGLADLHGLHQRAKVLLILPEYDTLAAQSEQWLEKVKEAGDEARVEVMRCPGMTHGWTQFPESWINKEQKKEKDRVFRRVVDFLRETWPEAGMRRRGTL